MSDVLEEAKRLYADSLACMREQRTQIEEDLRFSDPSDPDQWDETVKQQRLNDPGGRRPCLVMDQTGQYVANVVGQVEKNPPSIHAIPVMGGADKKAADLIDGRFRHIEHESRAQQHYARAETSAGRTGVGYLIIRPVVTDAVLNYQEPRIGSEPDPLRMVFDPWSTETDGSDGEFAFWLPPISTRDFKRRWPKAEPRPFGNDDYRMMASDDRESIVLGEQWTKYKETRQVFTWSDLKGTKQSGDENQYWGDVEKAQTRLPYDIADEHYECVKWRLMSGCEVLEEMEYPSQYIGVVPVYGYVGFKDGRMRYCGIPRRARSPQQAYNYHCSEMLAHIGTAPKSPWIVAARAMTGANFQDLWDRAAVDARSWLPYIDMDADGRPVPPPFRMPLAMDLRNHEAGAAQALRDLQASIGMYQANIGAESNVVSGVAYDSQKQQGEASTAHFPSHLAASIGQVGRVVADMDRELADTRRQQATMGVDGTPGRVTVDPDQAQAYRNDRGDISINPRVGTYGVRVVVGAPYATQRKETNAAFTEIMRGNQELAPIVAPFWAQTLDFPGSDKFAQAVAAMAPPAVRAILQPEGQDGKQPDPAQLQGQIEQLKQALNEAIKHAQAAQQDADEAIEGHAAEQRNAQTNERDLEIKAYQAETDRLKVTGANDEQIQAIVRELVENMLRSPDPLPGDPVEQQPPVSGAPIAPIEPEPPEPAHGMPPPQQPEQTQQPGA